MNAIVETDLLGWLECLFLGGAALAMVAAWRRAPAGPKGGLRLVPTGWGGVALGIDLLVAALAFVHGSVPMIAGFAQRADPLGLYLASVALLLALVQIVCGWLSPRFARSPCLARITAGNLGLIVALGVGHVVLNAGHLTSLG